MRIANLPVVRRRAPAMVVREPAKRRIRPLDRRCCCWCRLCWLPVARTPSELRRPSCTVSEKTDVDIVDAVESPRFLPAMNEPLAALPTPLDDVVVADESLRENIECPKDDSLSFDSINDFSWSSLLSGGTRRRLHRNDRKNANIKKNVAIIAQSPFECWSISFYLSLFRTRATFFLADVVALLLLMCSEMSPLCSQLLDVSPTTNFTGWLSLIELMYFVGNIDVPNSQFGMVTISSLFGTITFCGSSASPVWSLSIILSSVIKYLMCSRMQSKSEWHNEYYLTQKQRIIVHAIVDVI